MHTVQPASFPVTREVQPPKWLAGASRTVIPAFAPPPPVVSPEESAADELQRQMAEAIARGEAEGLARGEAAAREALAALEGRLSRLIEDLEGLQRRLVNTAQEQIVELSLSVAEAILEREVKADPDYTPRLVEAALEMVGVEDGVELSVSERDYGAVAQLVARLDETRGAPGNITLKADPTVEAGCVAETRLARVDARLATRLRQVADALTGDRGGAA